MKGQIDIENLIIELGKISTPHIADSMAKGLSVKLKHQVMDSAIKPLSPSFRLVGRAYTVRCYPGATYAMEKAVAEAPCGSVIVCDGKGSEAGALMGELMSTFAMQRGVGGAVIDGAVRDIDDIISMGFPVFSRYITPRNGVFEHAGDVCHVISCGSVVVSNGDIVCGDINGVVVIPAGIASKVLEFAELLVEWEEKVKELLLQGETLDDAARKFLFPQIIEI